MSNYHKRRTHKNLASWSALFASPKGLGMSESRLYEVVKLKAASQAPSISLVPEPIPFDAASLGQNTQYWSSFRFSSSGWSWFFLWKCWIYLNWFFYSCSDLLTFKLMLYSITYTVGSWFWFLTYLVLSIRRAFAVFSIDLSFVTQHDPHCSGNFFIQVRSR